MSKRAKSNGKPPALRDVPQLPPAAPRPPAEGAERLADGLVRTDRLALFGRLTRGFLHLLGNELGGMRMGLEVARSGRTQGERWERLADDLIASADRAARFVRPLAWQATGTPEAWSALNLDRVVGAARELLAAELEWRALQLHVEPPPEGVMAQVYGEEALLRQLVVHLVLNAADAAPTDGCVRLRLANTPDGPAGLPVLLEVVDRGRGMTREVAARCCEPWFSTRNGAAGLGLAVCRQIVHDHGGSMEIESDPGWGTSVRARFPAAAAARLPADSTDGEGRDGRPDT